MIPSVNNASNIMTTIKKLNLNNILIAFIRKECVDDAVLINGTNISHMNYAKSYPEICTTFLIFSFFIDYTRLIKFNLQDFPCIIAGRLNTGILKVAFDDERATWTMHAF